MVKTGSSSVHFLDACVNTLVVGQQCEIANNKRKDLHPYYATHIFNLLLQILYIARYKYNKDTCLEVSHNNK